MTSVEDVLKSLPPKIECPLCFLPFSEGARREKVFLACCGKVICCGCDHANAIAESDMGRSRNDRCCGFCRQITYANKKKKLEQIERLVAKNELYAMCHLGSLYMHGGTGLGGVRVKQDVRKALDLYCRASDGGHSQAAFLLSDEYYQGRVVERDERKEMEYLEIAARRGHVDARFNLGCKRKERGDDEGAMFHWRIAAALGHRMSLQNLKRGYVSGHVSKAEFADALRAFHATQEESKSEARDTAFKTNLRIQPKITETSSPCCCRSCKFREKAKEAA